VDKYAGAEEGPFLARLKPLSFGSIRQTASFQVGNLTIWKNLNHVVLMLYIQ